VLEEIESMESPSHRNKSRPHAVLKNRHQEVSNQKKGKVQKRGYCGKKAASPISEKGLGRAMCGCEDQKGCDRERYQLTTGY